MEEVVRNIKGRGKIIFPVYSEREAKDKGLEYKHWKECKPGEWGISDDGYVSLCLTKRVVNNKKSKSEIKRYIIGMVFGTNFITPKSYISFQERRINNTYSRTSSRSWDVIEGGKKRTKAALELATQQMISEGAIDYDKVGAVYRPDQVAPNVTAKRLFKNEHIQGLLRQSILDALSDNEIDEKLIIERFNELYEKGITAKQYNISMKANENLSKILQMESTPIRRKEVEYTERKVSRIGSRLDAEEKSIKASQEDQLISKE